jgi:hypothetical protein
LNVSHLELEGNHKVRQRILDEVQDILMESLTPDQITALVDRDMDAMEQAAQRLLRLIGGRVMGTLVEVSVLRHVGPPPICPRCSRPMRLVDRHRERKMHGLVGDFTYSRPYFHCRACGGALVPDDERFGVGTLSYTPALSRVAAAQAVDVPFERAARKLSETLGADFCEAEVYRAVESLGVVAESEIQAEMAMPAAPPPAPDGDTLVMGMDGTTSFIEGAWHEVKVGVVGTLGPETKRDPNTGRELFAMKNPLYCAAANTEADAFMPRFLRTVRQAGHGHPTVRRVVFINDGGAWIWNRGSQLDQEGVERIEILDYYHVTEHVWHVADAFFGPHSLDGHAWVRPVLETLLDQGPESLMQALKALRPRTKDQKEELRKAMGYFSEHLERMRYPKYIAMKMPIASGLVEATCRSVVCQRTKGAGMRWTRLGAQAVLNLRCLYLSSHDRWRTFFDHRPLRTAPRVALIRRESQDAA